MRRGAAYTFDNIGAASVNDGRRRSQLRQQERRHLLNAIKYSDGKSSVVTPW